MNTLDPIIRGGTWRLLIDTPGTATDWATTPVEVYLDHETTGERVKLRHLVGSAPYDGVAVSSPDPGVLFAMPPAWTSLRTPGFMRATVAVNGATVRDVLPAEGLRVLVSDTPTLD